MLSQDINNFAFSFEALARLGEPVTMDSATLMNYAYCLSALADRVAMLEAHTVPTPARLLPENLPHNVVEIPRSKPWGGNPPGGGRGGNPPGGPGSCPPDGGAA